MNNEIPSQVQFALTQMRKHFVDEQQLFPGDHWDATVQKMTPGLIAMHIATVKKTAEINKPEPPPPTEPVRSAIGKPGTRLKAMLASWRCEMKPGCDCEGKAKTMDQMGIAGCEKNFWMLVGIMKDGSDKWGWSEKLKIGATLSLVDPGLAARLGKAWPEIWPVILREAIDREKATLN